MRWLGVPPRIRHRVGGLDVPPLFALEGPDGGRVRLVLDAWASRRHNYTQGRALLEDPKRIAAEWLPRFEALGEAYPPRDILALGTHGDLGPQSAGEVERFATAIREWNAREDTPARLVNATLAGFCRAIDAAESRRSFLPTVRGDFGHSWEAWPVSLAAHAAAAREAEREMLAAEALAALAGGDALAFATRPARERAEWTWAMLGDHAWNGTDDANRRENATLRRRWADELTTAARDLAERAWNAAGFVDRSDAVTLFNPTAFSRRGVVRFALPAGRPKRDVLDPEGHVLPSQYVLEEEDQPVLYFTPPLLAAYATATLGLATGGPPPATALTASPTTLEGPFYRVVGRSPHRGPREPRAQADRARRWSSRGLRTVGQTVYFDGREAELAGFESDVETVGTALARLHVAYRTGPAETALFVTLYATEDRVDLRLPRLQEADRARGAPRPRLPGRAPGRDAASRHHRGRRPPAPGARGRPREGREHAPLRHPGLRGRLAGPAAG